MIVALTWIGSIMGSAFAALRLREHIASKQDDTLVSGNALPSHFAGDGDNNGFKIVSSLKTRLTPSNTLGGSIPDTTPGPIPTVVLGVNPFSAERGDSGLTGIRP